MSNAASREVIDCTRGCNNIDIRRSDTVAFVFHLLKGEHIGEIVCPTVGKAIGIEITVSHKNEGTVVTISTLSID